MACNDIPASPVNKGKEYVPDEIILYGTSLIRKHTCSVAIPIPIIGAINIDVMSKYAAITYGGTAGNAEFTLVLTSRENLMSQTESALTLAEKIGAEVLETEGEDRVEVMRSAVHGLPSPIPLKSDDRISIAVVFGYAYEGHCYRLDKAKILVFQGVAEPAVGCGYDWINPPVPPGEAIGYEMWRVRSLATVLELTTNYDYFQSVILEGNLPGKRVPNTYAANLKVGPSLAHRGGRLTHE
jgi:hypothetical protein